MRYCNRTFSIRLRLTLAFTHKPKLHFFLKPFIFSSQGLGFIFLTPAFIKSTFGALGRPDPYRAKGITPGQDRNDFE